jgi:succinoglycan biosynthesis transport protein ExoP
MVARMMKETGASDERGADEAGLIDLRRLAALLRRRWPVIAAVSAVVILFTYLAYQFATPLYSATAQVAIDRRDDELASSSATPALPTDSPSVDTEAQVLTSPALAGVVVDRLGLARDPEFAGKVPANANAARDHAITALIGKTLVKRIGFSYAISVTSTSTSPTQAARVANGIVDGYVASGLGGKESERQREVTLLSQRLGQLRGAVITAETAIPPAPLLRRRHPLSTARSPRRRPSRPQLRRVSARRGRSWPAGAAARRLAWR